ncbi:SRPBCC family protein [Terriglobus aquaticus]|uniref:SRPBCC domain-containing protein n=1 Tax=Terriglobus aquaticus TaxID=940139 RepID=A0ABW9KRV0_9BACT|nr:SRPBCC domain-containing protein [Terriglobus aquaticus]
MANGTATEPQRMTVTRVFDAPRELVWKAWTSQEYAAQWWGPKGFTAPFCEIDFRVGGKYRFCMRSPEGQEYWTGGEYYEIVPHEKIVLSLYPVDAEGNKVDPAVYGIEHEAIEGAHDVVLFEDLGNGKTRLTLIGNETMESAKESGQVEGWNQILEKFADVVAQLLPAGTRS